MSNTCMDTCQPWCRLQGFSSPDKDKKSQIYFFCTKKKKFIYMHVPMSTLLRVTWFFLPRKKISSSTWLGEGIQPIEDESFLRLSNCSSIIYGLSYPFHQPLIPYCVFHWGKTFDPKKSVSWVLTNILECTINEFDN